MSKVISPDLSRFKVHQMMMACAVPAATAFTYTSMQTRIMKATLPRCVWYCLARHGTKRASVNSRLGVASSTAPVH